jgi:purine-binding chemotaxis protein CheW
METNSQRYLCFRLGQDDFAISLSVVREVVGFAESTIVPFMPAYFSGIINLRGNVISVVDLRKRLGLQFKNTEETVIIMSEVGSTILGLTVDAVNKVISLEQSEISPCPEMESKGKLDYISGVFKENDKLILIMDLQKLFSVHEINSVVKSHKSA